jgi:hypothetical protein
VKPKVASSLATEMSHAAASPSPPARQCPAKRPMTGLGASRMRSNTSMNVRPEPGFGGSPDTAALRSAPAQNVFPRFVSTTARTASSAMAPSRWSARLSTSSTLRALRFSGRLSVMVATPAATSSSVAASLGDPVMGGEANPEPWTD